MQGDLFILVLKAVKDGLDELLSDKNYYRKVAINRICVRKEDSLSGRLVKNPDLLLPDEHADIFPQVKCQTNIKWVLPDGFDCSIISGIFYLKMINNHNQTFQIK